MLRDITNLGQQIQKVQLGIEQRQLNLTVADYNNQIRVANRSLGDARDMYAAIRGHVKATLGGMEGQNLVLGRQLQLLGLELEQRQINFKLAMAGFTAPGDTPEQRQARIDQAKIEAGYAQKQLDINKQMGKSTFAINTIQAQRAVTDLEAQVGLLVRGRDLAIDTSAAQKAIEAMNQDQEILLEKAKSYVAEGTKTVGLLNSAITDIMSKTDDAFVGWEKDLVHAFRAAGVAFSTSLINAMNPDNYGAGSGGGISGMSNAQIIKLEKKYNEDLNGNGRIGASEGFLGTVNTPTNFTAGEVNGETVVVLKNPKSIAPGGMGSGGGTVNVNISIAGGGDIDEKKLATWGKQIQRETIAALNRQTSLLGLRTP
jgi:hypothetical protein